MMHGAKRMALAAAVLASGALLCLPAPTRAEDGEGAAKSVESGMEKAGSATKSGMEKAGSATGDALDKALKATGDGVGYAIDKTGEGFKKAGDAMTGSGSDAAEADSD